MAKKKEVEDAVEPNVKFVGGNHDMSAKDVKKGEEGFVPREPIKGFRDGMTQYKLPPVEEQMAKDGFYYEHANTLVKGRKKIYKLITEKGAK